MSQKTKHPDLDEVAREFFNQEVSGDPFEALRQAYTAAWALPHTPTAYEGFIAWLDAWADTFKKRAKDRERQRQAYRGKET